MVQVQPINKHALQRYREFWNALQTTDQVLLDAKRMATSMSEKDADDWRVPEKDEVVSAATKADAALEVLARTAKKWEAVLISRTWRT